MRGLWLFLIAVSFVGLPSTVARAGDEGITARGLFIQARPKQRTRRPRPPVGAQAQPPVVSPTTNPQNVSNGDPVAHGGPVGLGLSLFRVINQAEAIRVDPASTFRQGDAIRFVIEPGIDGYLYVFVRTGAGAPVMVYPDARLESGDNFVYAHTVTEVPSRRNRALDVFRLTGSPAVEHITIVLCRQPLPNVPIAENLVAHCAAKADRCLWSPDAEVVAEVKEAVSKPALVSAVRDAGKRVPEGESAMLTREIVLGSSDDAPSIVAVAGSVNAPLFAYEFKITHEK